MSAQSENCICVNFRKYVGKGKLVFNHSETIDCDFEFTFRNDGKSLFESVSYLTNNNTDTVLDNMSPETVTYVSFKGIDTEGGIIEVQKMGLDRGDINEVSIAGLPNPSRYKLNRQHLAKLLSTQGKQAYVEYFVNGIFTVRFRFLLASPLSIIYEEDISEQELITSISGLSNFQFGPPNDDSNKSSPSVYEFTINEDSFEITFRRKSEYNKIINQSAFNRNVDITSEAIIETKMRNVLQGHKTLSKLCMLLSFANSNWIIPIYTDIIKNDKIIKTTFYNSKTYPFVNSRYVIDPREMQKGNLVTFLTTSYRLWDDLVREFRIHMVIEYYISGQANTISQEEFSTGYIALEILCNMFLQYAKRNNEVIEIRAIKETETKLANIFEELGIQVSPDQISKIADKVAYKHPLIKDVQKYLLNKLKIPYDKKLIDRLYKIRNNLWHGVDYDSTNIDILRNGTTELFDLLDRIILKMLGCQGQTYMSKTHGFKPMILQ